MKQNISFITLGVNDLETAKKFYTEKFGWATLRDSDGIVFFKLNGIILSLFDSHELAEDAGVSTEGSGFKKFTLAICLNSEHEVDETFMQLKQKGVNIIKAPQKVFWGGYSGYVEDVEHNLWEIAYNPFIKLDENGSVMDHT